MSEGPPLRLRDDPAIARVLRDDLTRAAAHGDAGYDVAAGLAKYEETVRAGAGAAGGAGAGAGAKTVLGAAIKGALLGVVTLGGSAVFLSSSPSRAPAPAPAPPIASVIVPAAPSADEGSRAVPVPPAPSSAPLATTKPTVTLARVRDGEPRAAVTVVPRSPAPAPAEPAPPPASAPVAPSAARAPEPAAPSAAGGALAAELEHLARLRAREAGDPAEVLALAAEGNQRFPSGLFAQEREAIAIGALVRLGRLGEARTRARAFLASYPRSAFAERIKSLTEIGDDR